MTHEKFKEICLREYPKIEGMVKTVKALGVEYIHCDVYADGHINFDIHEKKDESFHTSWHCSGVRDGELRIVEYDNDHESWWAPKCYYDHAVDDDGVEDDNDFEKPLSYTVVPVMEEEKEGKENGED